MRTNIVLDDRLVKEVMRLSKARTKREAVDLALREFVSRGKQRDILALIGLDGTPVAGPVHGVYWLPALDHEGSLREMDLAAWREALRVRVKSLYTTMRAFYEQIAAPDTFLVSATRLGGQQGYDEAGAV